MCSDSQWYVNREFINLRARPIGHVNNLFICMLFIGGNTMDAKFEEILNDVNPEILENKDEDLFEEGILDSLTVMMLVSNLETAYSFYIDPDDIVEENFSTVDAIWNLVQKYQKA